MKKTALLRISSVVALWVCLMFLGSGCSDPGNARVTIRYMDHADHFGVTPEIHAAFEKKYPDIELEYIRAPQGGADRMHDKLVTMLAAGDGTIDLFTIDVIWPPELASAGWLLPLNEWFPPEEQQKYIPAMIDAQTVGGSVYGVPNLMDFGALFYRKDILEQAGLAPPKTWMELVEIARKLQQPPELFGYVSNFKADQQLICEYFEFLYSNGGAFLDETGTEIRFTSKESIEAVQFMVDMVNKYEIVQPGNTTMSVDEGRAIFTEGRAIFHRNWLYVWAMSEHHEASKVKGKVGVLLLPTFKEGLNASTLGGWSYCVNRFTKHKHEAVRAALFLGGAEAQKIRAIKGGRVPPMIPVLNDPEVVAKNPVYVDMAKVATIIRARPKSPFYTQISDIFQAQVQEAILMKKTPEQAVIEAAKQIKPLLEGLER